MKIQGTVGKLIGGTLLVLFGLLTTGCTTEQETCNIDVLLWDMSVETELPTEVSEVLLPFNFGADTICLPQGYIVGPGGRLTFIKEKTLMEKLRGGITKNTTMPILREKIKNHLNGLSIASIANKIPMTSDSIRSIAQDYDVVLGYVPSGKISELPYARNCFSGYAGLYRYIQDSVLSENPSARMLIIFNPPKAERPATDTGARFNTAQYESSITQMLQTQGPKATVEYQDSVVSGLHNFQDAYAAMKSTITTSEHVVGHHTSFLAFSIAIEWALRSGKSDDLVQMIGRDYNSDQKLPKPERTIWKLSTHKAEYNPLFQALQTKDSVELRKLQIEIRNRIKEQIDGLVYSDHGHEHELHPKKAIDPYGEVSISVVSQPDFILTKGCAGPTPRVVLAVNGSDGRPIPRSIITLDASAVSWISSPTLTQETTGAMSVRTNGYGEVSLSIRQPERFGGIPAVNMKFACNGTRANKSTIASVSIPICAACSPCN